MPIDRPASPVVSLRGVRHQYDQRVVLDNVSFDVIPGEMVAVVGPSGSGKSTLLNGIGMLDSFDSGTALLFGEPVPKPGSDRARRLLRDKVGYLFQNYALIDGLSVKANLELAAQAARVPRREWGAVIADALAQVGLSDTVEQKRKVYSLSGGEQQRVAIARLLVKRCELVLADEPTGSLDQTNADEIIALLQSLALSGAALVIVTHDAQLASACDRSVSLLPTP